MSRVGGGVQDLLPLCLLVGRNGRSNFPRLFLKARQWHCTVFAFGLLDIPRMGTVVFPSLPSWGLVLSLSVKDLGNAS